MRRADDSAPHKTQLYQQL